jgi:hypothetical protein
MGEKPEGRKAGDRPRMKCEEYILKWGENCVWDGGEQRVN